MPPLSFSRPLLAVEASTTAGSVALWSDGALVGVAPIAMGAGQDDRLFPAMQRLIQMAGLRASDLRAVVCGAGPGSFTSLRIAASLAKGLVHGAGGLLYAVPSLLLAGASVSGLPGGRYVVHADALRHERYVLPVRRLDDGTTETAGPLGRVSVEQLRAEAAAEARVAVLHSPLDDERHVVEPTLAALPLAGGVWRETPVSLAAWEPVYGRLAEAQVKWEERHGSALPDVPAVRA